MTRYLFVNCIADGPVDWKKPLTAAGQPGIKEAFALLEDGDRSIDLDLSHSADLALYSDDIARGAIVVGHSVEYHHGHLRAELLRRGIDPRDGLTRTICTMLALTGHVPKRNGRKGWPTFAEACDFFCITRAGTETAEDNARCLALVFKGMSKVRDLPEPKVWKDRHG